MAAPNPAQIQAIQDAGLLEEWRHSHYFDAFRRLAHEYVKNKRLALLSADVSTFPEAKGAYWALVGFVGDPECYPDRPNAFDTLIGEAKKMRGV